MVWDLMVRGGIWHTSFKFERLKNSRLIKKIF